MKLQLIHIVTLLLFLNRIAVCQEIRDNNREQQKKYLVELNVVALTNAPEGYWVEKHRHHGASRALPLYGVNAKKLFPSFFLTAGYEQYRALGNFFPGFDLMIDYSYSYRGYASIFGIGKILGNSKCRFYSEAQIIPALNNTKVYWRWNRNEEEHYDYISAHASATLGLMYQLSDSFIISHRFRGAYLLLNNYAGPAPLGHRKYFFTVDFLNFNVLF